MHWAPIVGLSGDLATFTGSVMICLDVVQREREFDWVRTVTKNMLSMLELKVRNIEIDGAIVKSKTGVQLTAIRRSAGKATWGCRILAGGFFLLLIARILEL